MNPHTSSPLALGPCIVKPFFCEKKKEENFLKKKEIMHNYSLGRVWVWGTVGHRGELSGLIWDFYVLSELIMPGPDF